MRSFSRPFAALALGSALLIGSACSDSPNATTVSSEQTAGAGQQNTADPTPTTSTSINQSRTELSTADLVKLAEPSVVRIETNGGVGTGFVVDSDGYILTNNHVVLGNSGRISNTIRVTMSDGSVEAATVVGTDPRSDLALLKIERTGLETLTFADLDATLIGQDVVAIGYALDLQQGEGPSFSVTRGIVSQKNRAINEAGISPIYGAIQTDAAINHGNSGGPLLNMFGEVVGINTALPPDDSATGIGFAVGSDIANAVVEAIREDGKVNRGLLGIRQFERLQAAKAKELGMPEGQRGLLVGQVDASSPVGSAGLQAGDVITSLGDVEVASETDLAVSLIKNSAGETVTLEYYRDGEADSLQVTLGTAP